MNVKNFVNELRVALSEIKAKGQTAIPVAGLEAYLAEVEKAADRTEQEQKISYEQANAKFQHEFETWKINAPLAHASSLEMFKTVIEAGATALKAAILINGGAAVALLTFIGNLLSKEAPPGVSFPLAEVNFAMLVFVGGVALGGVATGTRYLAQFFFAGPAEWAGHVFNVVSVLLAVLSFAAFVFGGYQAYEALPQ